MSQKMINIVEKVFKNLKSDIINEVPINAIPDKIYKLIPNVNYADEVSDILQRSKYKMFTISSKIKCLLFSYRNEYYLLYPYEFEYGNYGNFIDDEPFIEGFGIIALSLSFLIPFPERGFQILNEVFASDGNEFNYNCIAKFYKPFVLIKDTSKNIEICYIQDITRITALFLVNNNDFINLNLSTKTIKNFSEMLLLKSSRNISECIIRCLDSVSYEYCFLELYRCVEFLFYIQIAQNIIKKYNIKQKLFNKIIDLVVEREIVKRESETLLSLFHILNKNDIIQFYNFLLSHNYVDEPKKDRNGNENVDFYSITSSYVYKLRCRIAHLSYKHEIISSTYNWYEYIEYFSTIVLNIYKSLDDTIINLCEENNDWTLITI